MPVAHRQGREKLLLALGGEDPSIFLHPPARARTHFPHRGAVVHVRMQVAVAEGDRSTRVAESHDSGGHATHPWIPVVVETTVGHVEGEWGGGGDGEGFVGEVEHVGHPDDLLGLVRRAPCVKPVIRSLQTLGTKRG